MSKAEAQRRLDEARRDVDRAYGLRELRPTDKLYARQFREAFVRVHWALAVCEEWS